MLENVPHPSQTLIETSTPSSTHDLVKPNTVAHEDVPGAGGDQSGRELIRECGMDR